jgi:Family of unknown function (DUF5367)
MRRALWTGVLIWAVGTLGVRLGGHHVLRAHDAPRAALLYAVSFAAMAILVPRICRNLQIERSSWFHASAFLMLPTLILDPFSCLFFERVFPAIEPAAAGVFGGWMLICCAGAVVGVWARR